MNWLNLFIETPGDFLYFLVVIALSQTMLMLAWGYRRQSPQDRAAQRYTLAAFGLVAAWVVLFIGALYSLASRQDARAILPPLERAVMLVSVLLVGWAFLTADHTRWTRRADMALLVALALAAIGYIATSIIWAGSLKTLDFNLMPHSPIWAFVTAVAALLGLIAALAGWRDVRDAPLKAVFFALVCLGQGVALVGMARGAWIGDYLGSVRLTWVMALTLVPIIVYRLVMSGWTTALTQARAIRITTTQTAAPVRTGKTGELPAIATDKRSTQEFPPAKAQVETQAVLLLKFLGMVLEAASPSSIPELIVTASLDGLRGDVGALLRVQDANYADFSFVLDKTRGRTRAGMALNLDHQPTLVNAMERREQRPLYMDRNNDEIEDLYTRLDLEQMGPVYFQPLVRQQEVVAVLMIAMPYSARELSTQERELLKSMATISSNLLAISYEAQEASILAEERAIQAMVEGVQPGTLDENSVLAARQEMQASLQAARNQISLLNRQVTSLTLSLDDERTRIAALLEGGSGTNLSISQRVVALNEEHKRLREERDTLTKRLQEAEAMLSGATASDESVVINNVAEAVLKEQEALQHERDRLQEALNALRMMTVSTPDDVQALLTQMQAEQSRLGIERTQLQERLAMLEKQLEEMGLQGGSTVHTNVINHLYEERANLQSRLDAMQKERDALLHERTRISDTIQNEKERDTVLQSLQTQLENLAADREAALKQRDKLRAERDELAEKVNVVKENRARALADAAALEIELGEANEEQTRLRTQVQTLSDEKSELLLLRDGLNAELQRLYMNYEQLTARAEGDAARMQRLSEEGTNSLKQMVDELLADRKRLEQELTRARGALGDTEYQLSISQKMAAINPDAPPAAPVSPPSQPELLVSLVQELRTPMTSIQGYVDLLLGESVGILGASQRKFLQRVSANVTRLATMLEDLIRMTALDTGQVRLSPMPVDVVHVIEDAITSASVQFREKGLTVNFSLQDDLPPINADQDALTQIIGQLLTNAYLVSPPDSELFIRAYARRMTLNDQMVDCAYVAVEDRGGGIPPEDVARVFARKYKAENPLIGGLGDTGVGLSIARALVEAHGGQLWLETKMGVGSTFSFALPIQPMVER